MKTLQEIKSILDEHKPYLLANYPIRSLAIFGSYARNEPADQSDVDIMVEFNDKIGSRFVDLADEIERLIGINVDLVSRNGIKAKYYEAIKPDLVYV